MPRLSSRVRGLAVPPFDRLNQQAASLERRGSRVISLGQAVPGFPPPPAALEAVRGALDDPATHRYSPDAGLATLREALCAKFASELGIAATPAHLIVSAGGNQAFMLAAMAAVDPGDDVLLAAPFFVNHEMAVRAAGATPIEVPLSERNQFRARWQDVEPHLTARTRAVVLCSPSNPTGAVVQADDLSRIVAELARRGIVVISDETYLHFVLDGRHVSAASLPGWSENVIVVGTFSKSFAMTGWRTGFLLAHPDLCDDALKIQDAMIICAPVVSQVAVEAAVRHDWNYIHRFHGELRRRSQALAAGLARIPRLRWASPDGGFFAFVRVEGCDDSAALAADILERSGVVTIPGSTFGGSGEGCLRLSYGAAGIDEIQEACARLERYFALSPEPVS